MGGLFAISVASEPTPPPTRTSTPPKPTPIDTASGSKAPVLTDSGTQTTSTSTESAPEKISPSTPPLTVPLSQQPQDKSTDSSGNTVPTQNIAPSIGVSHATTSTPDNAFGTPTTALQLITPIIITSAPITPTASPSSTPATSSTPTNHQTPGAALPSSTPPNSHSEKRSSQVNVGILVGGLCSGLVVLLAISAAIIYYRRRKKALRGPRLVQQVKSSPFNLTPPENPSTPHVKGHTAFIPISGLLMDPHNEIKELPTDTLNTTLLTEKSEAPSANDSARSYGRTYRSVGTSEAARLDEEIVGLRRQLAMLTHLFHANVGAVSRPASSVTTLDLPPQYPSDSS